MEPQVTRTTWSSTGREGSTNTAGARGKGPPDNACYWWRHRRRVPLSVALLAWGALTECVGGCSPSPDLSSRSELGPHSVTASSRAAPS